MSEIENIKTVYAAFLADSYYGSFPHGVHPGSVAISDGVEVANYAVSNRNAFYYARQVLQYMVDMYYATKEVSYLEQARDYVLKGIADATINSKPLRFYTDASFPCFGAVPTRSSISGYAEVESGIHEGKTQLTLSATTRIHEGDEVEITDSEDGYYDGWTTVLEWINTTTLVVDVLYDGSKVSTVSLPKIISKYGIHGQLNDFQGGSGFMYVAEAMRQAAMPEWVDVVDFVEENIIKKHLLRLGTSANWTEDRYDDPETRAARLFTALDSARDKWEQCLDIIIALNAYGRDSLPYASFIEHLSESLFNVRESFDVVVAQLPVVAKEPPVEAADDVLPSEVLGAFVYQGVRDAGEGVLTEYWKKEGTDWTIFCEYETTSDGPQYVWYIQQRNDQWETTGGYWKKEDAGKVGWFMRHVWMDVDKTYDFMPQNDAEGIPVVQLTEHGVAMEWTNKESGLIKLADDSVLFSGVGGVSLANGLYDTSHANRTPWTLLNLYEHGHIESSSESFDLLLDTFKNHIWRQEEYPDFFFDNYLTGEGFVTANQNTSARDDGRIGNVFFGWHRFAPYDSVLRALFVEMGEEVADKGPEAGYADIRFKPNLTQNWAMYFAPQSFLAYGARLLTDTEFDHVISMDVVTTTTSTTTTTTTSTTTPIPDINRLHLLDGKKYIYRDYEKFKIDNNINTVSTLIIRGKPIVVGDVDNDFVWDIGGESEYVFYFEGDIQAEIEGIDYNIEYEGRGSHLFKVILLNNMKNFYKQLSDLIDSSQRRGIEMDEYLSDMISVLEKSEISENSIDKKLLENSIKNIKEKIDKYHIEYSREVFQVVHILQKTIEHKYGNLNSFLKDNNIKVGNMFADISIAVGFPIDSENIRDI